MASCALKSCFNCTGAYLSTEMNRQQIRGIRKPADFKLYYSIYHPIDLMTSRQCLFQQVGGCVKQSLDEECIPSCRKSASISNESKGTLFIGKTEDNYNRIYNGSSYLNTEIVSDLRDLFSGFLIDLREIKTNTRVTMDPPGTIELFEDLLKGTSNAAQKIHQVIQVSTNSQYSIGI